MYNFFNKNGFKVCNDKKVGIQGSCREAVTASQETHAFREKKRLALETKARGKRENYFSHLSKFQSDSLERVPVLTDIWDPCDMIFFVVI